MSDRRDVGLFILEALAWVPVEVKPRGKVPIGDAWQTKRPTRDDVLRWPVATNLGVLLGTASGDLTDIDLDVLEAAALAHYFLPSTWIYGRASKPRSHWLYYCRGARSHAFKDGAATILEIRSDTSKGPGHQTVLPPSVHTSGELIEWDLDGADATDGPRVIEWATLARQVALLARATIALRAGLPLDEARRVAMEHRPVAPVTQRRRTTPKASADVMARARRYVAKMDSAISGSGGHDATFAVAVALVRGFALDEGDAFAILSDYNVRCSPPWSEAELKHKLTGAAKADRVPHGCLRDEVKS